MTKSGSEKCKFAPAKRNGVDLILSSLTKALEYCYYLSTSTFLIVVTLCKTLLKEFVQKQA